MCFLTFGRAVTSESLGTSSGLPSGGLGTSCEVTSGCMFTFCALGSDFRETGNGERGVTSGREATSGSLGTS